ncbi:helix-turn-helix domain-containing protein [Salana multivorans]
MTDSQERRTRILNLADVAEMLGITVPTARTLVQQGEIIGFQIGGRGMWRVESVELDNYIQRKKDEAAQRRKEDHAEVK